MISFPTVLLRLVLALVLGALIGLERESNEHAAGMRTNALVAMGCALFSIISAFGFTSLLGLPHISLDPTRIASYVVAGIGFLGGGAIFVRQDKERVKGLTTAAAIWVVAAIGLACGAGLLWEAITATALTLIVLVIMRYVERFMLLRPISTHHIHVEVASSDAGQFLSSMHDICIRHNTKINELQIQPEGATEMITLVCDSKEAAELLRVVTELRELNGVRIVKTDLEGTNKRDM